MLNYSALLLALASGNTTVADGDLLHAIPKDSVFVVRSAALDELRAAAQKNAWCRFFHDDAFAQLRQSCDGLLKELHDGHLPVDPTKICEALHGRAALFVRVDPTSNQTSFGLVLEPGADRKAFDAELAPLYKFADAAHARSTRSLSGVAVSVWEPESAPASEHAKHSKECFASFDLGAFSTIVAGENEDELISLAQGMVDRLRGADAAGGMDTNNALLDARKASGANGGVEAFVDLAALIHLGQRHDAPSDETRKLLDAFGVDELRWIHARADLGEGENIEAAVCVKLPERGAIAKWLDALKPVDVSLGRYLPRDAISVTLANFDLWGAFNSVMSTMRELAPKETAQVEQGLDMLSATDTEIDVKADFLSQFTGGFGAFDVAVPASEALGFSLLDQTLDQDAKAKLPANGETLGSAAFIGLKDVARVQSFLDHITKLAGVGDQIDEEDVAGEKVWFVESPAGKFSWSFQDHGVCFSMFPSAMKAMMTQVANASKGSALDEPRFRSRLSETPDACVVSVVRTPEMLNSTRYAVEVLKAVLPNAVEKATEHHPAKAEADQRAAELESRLREAFANFNWPSREVIARYFSGSVALNVRRLPGVLRITYSGH